MVAVTLPCASSVDARLTQNGRTSEFWAERPNKLRIERPDGRYEISNGSTVWVVNETDNTATRKPSPYYRQAQRKGIDVLDLMFDLARTDLSGFFYEGPTGREKREAVEYLKYAREFTQPGELIRFKALVDPKTHLIELLSVSLAKEEGGPEQVMQLEVLEHGLSIPDGKFTFKPGAAMDVRVEKEAEEPPTSKVSVGATLSGRIVWGKNLKPVSGALITVFAQRKRSSRRRRSRRAARGSQRFRGITTTSSRWARGSAPTSACNPTPFRDTQRPSRGRVGARLFPSSARPRR